MLRDIYLLIRQRLLNAQNPPNHVLWYNQQYVAGVEDKVIDPASAYVEFLPVSLDELSEERQEGVLNFRIHLADEVFDEDDLQMSYFDVVESIFLALHGKEGWLSDIAGNEGLAGTSDDVKLLDYVARTGIETDHNQSDLVVTIQDFSARVADNRAEPKRQSVTVTPTVTR